MLGTEQDCANLRAVKQTQKMKKLSLVTVVAVTAAVVTSNYVRMACQCKLIQTLLLWISVCIKMVWYTIAECTFIVKTYQHLDLTQTIQYESCKSFGGWTGPLQSMIHNLPHKPKIAGIYWKYMEACTPIYLRHSVGVTTYFYALA